MFSIATTCVVLVFLSSANRLGLTKIVKNKSYEQELITEDGLNFNEWNRTEIEGKYSHCICKEVQNLEIYATDESSISMRYDLPNKTIGVPIEIQVIWCEYDKKSECKSSISNITRCSLFPAKYCVDIKNLLNNSKYLLKISLRNDIMPIFGLEKEIEAEVSEKIPGKPKINMTIFDCPHTDLCYLDIILDHPYNQNGSITAFEIIIFSSRTVNNVTDNARTQDKYYFNNKNYLPQYIFHFTFDSWPYREKFNLYIQSQNSKYKSDFTMAEVLDTRDVSVINKNPVLWKTTGDSFTFKVSTFAKTSSIIVQEYNNWQEIEINSLKNRHLCLNHGNTWIADKTVLEPGTFTISQDTTGKNRLIPNKKYCITFLRMVYYEKSILEYDIYFENLELLHSSDDFDSEPNANVYRYISFISLSILIVSFVIIILLSIFVVRLLKMRKPAKDHQYEDMEDNYNEYDHLSHK